MIQLYVQMILNGEMKLEDIKNPKRREQVREALENIKNEEGAE